MTQFDTEKETVVFVTGFLIPADTNYAVEMAKAYNCRGGYNFIVSW